jgi:uncharacterized protein (DUF58 family)
MPGASERPRLTSLFGNDVLDRLERLRISPLRRLTSRSHGEHLSGKGGSSTEFSDYRDYVVGDDVRFVDWNIFARLNRPYLKLFQMEEEMHVLLLVDASASMGFESKLQRAKQLAAAFGLMGLMGGERVSAYAFNARQGAPARFAPTSGRANLSNLLRFLERVESGGDAPVEAGIETCLKYHIGRGVAVVVSDFLTFGDVGRALNLLFSSGMETFGLQVLAPAELEPDLAGDVRLVDRETEQTLDVSSANDLLGLYREYREHLERRLAEMLRQRGGRFMSVSSEAPLEWVLFDQLRRRGWVQ